MAGAKLEKTRWPGIYRRGARYAVVYRDKDGKQRKETARTLDDARALKRRREGGETNTAGRLTFAEYAREWESAIRRATPPARTTDASSNDG